MGSSSLPVSALAGLTRTILDRGVPFRFSAPGSSMSPFIRNGDIITIAPYDAAACRPGLVVAYVNPGNGQLVVHRVVAVSGGVCRTRGDNTPVDDGEIPHASIAGQVIRVERSGKVIRFGLGPERAIIALFSRRGWLRFVVRNTGRVRSAMRRVS